MHLILILSCFAAFTLAINVFNSNCTLPETSVQFISSPNSRGTLDILWSCLATIVACVYTVLHLNVPDQLPGHNLPWTTRFEWQLQNTQTNLKYAVLSVFLPELILTKSVADWREARRSLLRLHRERPETKKYWTQEHMLYAGMGGFVAVWLGEKELSMVEVPELTVNKSPTIAEIDGDIESQYEGRPSSSSTLWHFTMPTLTHAILEGLVPLEPPVTKEDISNKSKSDLLGRIVAIFQITHFLVSIIARAAQHLPATQLELGACAFVPYAIAIYCFSFGKPKSVTSTTVVQTFQGCIPQSIREIHDNTVRPTVAVYSVSSARHNLAVSGDESLTVTLVLPILLSIPFGAMHLAAWNFNFPSHIDLQLWRAAAVVTSTALPALFVVTHLQVLIDRITGIHTSNVFNYLYSGALLGGFFLARLTIIVEMFRCLAYLPSDAFKATWTNNIPHIG